LNAVPSTGNSDDEVLFNMKCITVTIKVIDKV